MKRYKSSDSYKSDIKNTSEQIARYLLILRDFSTEPSEYAMEEFIKVYNLKQVLRA